MTTGEVFANRFRLLVIFLLACLTGCTGLHPIQPNRLSGRILFQFSVLGKLELTNPNITYYVVLNAPDNKKAQSIDPATNGPRINGPSLDFPATTLQGRLPFIGQLPGDIASVWTDFYYIQGSATGSPIVGRGVLINGVPQILVRNYPATFWRRLNDGSTFEIQMLYSDIFENEANKPSNITVNLASSDSIENGQGFVYDHWRANLPFSIKTEPNTAPQREYDTNEQLNLRQIPTRPMNQLSSGVEPDSVNIVGYEYTVRQL